MSVKAGQAQYLKRLRPLLPMHEGDVDRALEWATEPVARTAALLMVDPDLPATFRVADPVIDYVERRDGHKLPPTVWDHLVTHLSVEDAMTVAFAAYTRRELDAAQAAFQRVINSYDPDQAPRALFSLGLLLREEKGDLAGARAALEQVIDSRHSHVAPLAAHVLGSLLQQEGDLAGARAAFQQASDSDHPIAPMATVNLGALLEQEGDLAGARAAFQLAMDSSDEAVASLAETAPHPSVN